MIKFFYFKVCIFFIVIVCISSFLIYVALLLNKKRVVKYKFRAVECGSHPFGSGFSPIEISFLSIGILFVIFELEILILIPWVLYWDIYLFKSGFAVLIFCLLVLFGLFYEADSKIFVFE